MATTEGGRTKLQQLNIPCVQVGKATLTQGAGTVNGLSGVTMADVTFFAFSTGNIPRIWATNNVGGSYSAAPTPVSQGGAVVPLSCGGLSANFGINRWDGGVNGKWGAMVTPPNALPNAPNGVGSYQSPFSFQGAAAGTINSGNTFSGTGSGTAH